MIMKLAQWTKGPVSLRGAGVPPKPHLFAAPVICKGFVRGCLGQIRSHNPSALPGN